jgi:cytochrome P450
MMAYSIGADSQLASTLDWCDPPEHVPPDLVIRFDLARDTDISLHPWERTMALRERPMWWTQAPPWNHSSSGSWIPTRADDIRFIMQNPELFTSVSHAPIPENMPHLIPVQTDPPEHTK